MCNVFIIAFRKTKDNAAAVIVAVVMAVMVVAVVVMVVVIVMVMVAAMLAVVVMVAEVREWLRRGYTRWYLANAIMKC